MCIRDRCLPILPPRVVRALLMERRAVLFTDGACDPGADGELVVSVGAVLFPVDGGARCFGLR
eukprot:6341851-Alexandrium_andersonii.AAC.1